MSQSPGDYIVIRAGQQTLGLGPGWGLSIYREASRRIFSPECSYCSPNHFLGCPFPFLYQDRKGIHRRVHRVSPGPMVVPGAARGFLPHCCQLARARKGWGLSGRARDGPPSLPSPSCPWTHLPSLWLWMSLHHRGTSSHIGVTSSTHLKGLLGG